METIGEIENIAASKLNYNDVLNKPLPKANLESFKPKFFDKIGVMEKIGEKRFIPIKVHTNSDPAIEKLKRFFRADKRKRSLPKKSLNETNTKTSFFENTQAEIKTNYNEIENDQIGYISKSFLCSKRENNNYFEPSLESLNSNLCDIRTVQTQDKKITTTEKSFNKKFIRNLGEDYSPKLLTTKSCK